MFWLLEKKLTVSHVIFMWCCVTVEHDLICPAAKNKTSEPCYHESFKEIHFQLLLYICQKSSAVKRSVFLDLNFPILPPFLFSSHTFICVLWVLLVLFYCDNHEITKKNSINLCVSWNSFPPSFQILARRPESSFPGMWIFHWNFCDRLPSCQVYYAPMTTHFFLFTNKSI